MGGIDPRLLQIALRVYGEYSAQDDEKATLLASLKPFLKAERLEKMEKAEKIARLSRVVRVAIQLLREEGEGRTGGNTPSLHPSRRRKKIRPHRAVEEPKAGGH